MFDDIGKTVLWCIKAGTIAMACALLFLACTGQLPSDPG